MKEGIITITIVIVAILAFVAFTKLGGNEVVFEQNMATPSPLTDGDSISDIEEDLNNLELPDVDPDLSAIEEQL